MEGLAKDNQGHYSEAMELYVKAGELGNKAGFLNMGNCYMFGRGMIFWFGESITQNKKWGIEMYGECETIGDDELGWIRELSNDKFVCGKELDLSGLFFILFNVITCINPAFQ